MGQLGTCHRYELPIFLHSRSPHEVAVRWRTLALLVALSRVTWLTLLPRKKGLWGLLPFCREKRDGFGSDSRPKVGSQNVWSERATIVGMAGDAIYPETTDGRGRSRGLTG